MKKNLVGSSIVVVRIFGLNLSRTSLNNCRPTPLRVRFLCNFVVNWMHLGNWFSILVIFYTMCEFGRSQFPNNATKPKLLTDAPKPGHGNVALLFI